MQRTIKAKAAKVAKKVKLKTQAEKMKAADKKRALADKKLQRGRREKEQKLQRTVDKGRAAERRLTELPH